MTALSRPAVGGNVTAARAVKASNGAALANAPRRSRLRLDTLDRVRRELVKLYREGRDGLKDTQDVSRLANVLAIVGRLIEGGELEHRLEAIEKRTAP